MTHLRPEKGRHKMKEQQRSKFLQVIDALCFKYTTVEPPIRILEHYYKIDVQINFIDSEIELLKRSKNERINKLPRTKARSRPAINIDILKGNLPDKPLKLKSSHKYSSDDLQIKAMHHIGAAFYFHCKVILARPGARRGRSGISLVLFIFTLGCCQALRFKCEK